MITLGLELSSTIFKFLRQDEVERIVLEIAKISTVPIEKRDAVIQEAYQRAIALKYINEGGIEYAKEILERSLRRGSSRRHDEPALRRAQARQPARADQEDRTRAAAASSFKTSIRRRSR